MVAVPRSNPSEPVRGPAARRGPGRPRSEEAAAAVLEAAYRLAAAHGLKGATLQAIADDTGVSKMTIYKWWPNRLQLLIDAYLLRTNAVLPIADVGSAADAIRAHATRYVRALKGDLGRFQLAVYAECLAETGSTALFVERYLSVRRDKGLAAIRRGQAEGSIASAQRAEDLYDQIYGAIFYRFQFGLGGLTEPCVRNLVVTVLNARAVAPAGQR